MLDYPTQFPADAAQVLLDWALRKSTFDLRGLNAAAVTMEMYAIGQLTPAQKVAPMHFPIHPAHKERLAVHMQNALTGGIVNWAEVIQIVVGLMQAWLAGHFPPTPAPTPAS